MSRADRSISVTGREELITKQALVYAIALIQSLPEDAQDYSNMCDMCAIARTIAPIELGQFILQVQRKAGLMIDIWPDEPNAEQERRERYALKFSIGAMVEGLSAQLTAA